MSAQLARGVDRDVADRQTELRHSCLVYLISAVLRRNCVILVSEYMPVRTFLNQYSKYCCMELDEKILAQYRGADCDKHCGRTNSGGCTFWIRGTAWR